MRALVWLRNDLRIADQPALSAARRHADAVSCVYCLDARWERPTRFGTQPLGRHRAQFLHQALEELRGRLDDCGIALHVVRGDPAEQVIRLCRETGVGRIHQGRPPAYDELQDAARVQAELPGLDWQTLDTSTLFDQRALVGVLQDFPGTFSRFRRRVESLQVPAPLAAPGSDVEPDPKAAAELAGGTPDGPEFHGGELAGQRHLADYLAGAAASSYKQTRNALDDDAAYTRLSPWLAAGSLSPRQVLASLREYEAQHGANESTYWIYFELLWREYFHWYAQVHGARLFAFAGIGGRRPLTTFYPRRFRAWREGRTPWPLVNACMRRLNQTGYLSNRGRQIAASCLVNELETDWRSGAAWFEQQLVDYDVASNWGNWQYIAGVGADPRGGRHFNLEKQARDFDPDGAFVARWGGAQDTPVPLDAVDAADWPLGGPGTPPGEDTPGDEP